MIQGYPSWASPQKKGREGTYTSMFIAALFTIAKLWKQPRCPSTDEWIMKLWCMYTMECYSATRNNDMAFEGKWMQFEDIVLREVSQNQKHNRHIFSYMEDISKDIHTKISMITHKPRCRTCL
jgi:hypothetical protein